MSDVLTHDDRLAAGQACLEAALWFLTQGIAPLCCCDPEHIAVGKHHGAHCDSPGKAPMHAWKAWQTTLPTAEAVQQYWRDYPIGNVGIILGQGAGVVRIDVDGEAGSALLAQWSAGDLPPTWIFASPSGGRGWLYGWPHALPCTTTTQAAPGTHAELRLMANGSQTIVPPSRHKTGGVYTWLPGHSPAAITLAPAPQWLRERLHQPVPAHPPTRPPGPRAADYDRVMQALALIPNDDAPYDDWLLIGMALHHTGAPWAREVWDAWSQQSLKFDAGKQDKSWASFGASTTPVTLGSLFHRAYPPQPAARWHERATPWAGQWHTLAPGEAPAWHTRPVEEAPPWH